MYGTESVEHLEGLSSSQSRVPNLVVKYKLAVEIYVKCYNYHNFLLNFVSILFRTEPLNHEIMKNKVFISVWVYVRS